MFEHNGHQPDSEPAYPLAIDVIADTALALVKDFGDVLPDGIYELQPWNEVTPYSIDLEEKSATIVLVPNPKDATAVVVEVTVRARSLMLESFPAATKED